MKRDDSSNLNAPLIEQSMLSEDPFFIFRDELTSRVEAATSRFEAWKQLLQNSNTAENSAFKEENAKLKTEVSELLTNVLELEEVVSRIELNRNAFSHVSDSELSSRQASVKELKQRINSIKYTMSSQRTLNKMKADSQAAQAKRAQAITSGITPMQMEKNEDYVRSQQLQQQMIMQEQDQHLDELHHSAVRLNVMAGTIGEEIEDQGRMIDAFSDDLDHTQSRMEHALGRMDKLLKTNNRCQTWTILMLILVATIMFFLVVS